MRRISTILIVLALFITACNAPLGNHPVGISKRPGTGRGTLANVEQQNSGMWQVWLFGDSSYVYCTMDDQLGGKALSILQETDATVIYTYRDYLSTDFEWNTQPYSGSSYSLAYWCGQGYSLTHGSKLLTLEPLRKK